IIQNSNGKLIGFFPYDPFRKNQGLEVLKASLKAGKFKGVKFYPPMGYNTCSNKDEWINEINMKLFTFCAGNGVPIFTHCTPTGFEVRKGSGINADPRHWENILENFPDLKLCLGHAGGVEGWFQKLGANEDFPKNSNGNIYYAETVYNLCTRFKNVYCEV